MLLKIPPCLHMITLSLTAEACSILVNGTTAMRGEFGGGGLVSIDERHATRTELSTNRQRTHVAPRLGAIVGVEIEIPIPSLRWTSNRYLLPLGRPGRTHMSRG